MRTYLFTFCLSFLVSIGLVPLVTAIARRLELVDMPNARNVHSVPTPRIGGTAFVLATLVAITIAFAFLPQLQSQFIVSKKQILAFLIVSVGIFSVGLLDDIRTLSGKFKFLALLVASLVTYWAGFCIKSLTVGTLFTVDLGWLSWPVTALWIIGITVGINFIDGVDGLAAGVSAISCGFIAIVALHVGQVVVAAIMIALIGSLVGFLFFNFNPAKIFMGDCGSMFLGFTIGVATVACASNSSSIEILGIPTVALGIPIIDAVCTFIRRGILERRSIFNAERGHIHHRLLDLGFNQKHTVIVLYFVTIVTAGLAMFTLATHDYETLIVLLCLTILYLLFFRAIGSYDLKQTISAIKRNRSIKRAEKNFQNHFEDVQLEYRRAQSFNDWWRCTCNAAEHLEFVSMTVETESRDGTIRTLIWKQKNNDLPLYKTTDVAIPFKDRRAGSNVRINAKVAQNDSLESAGKRMAYFMRLIDEHGISHLEKKQSGLFPVSKSEPD